MLHVADKTWSFCAQIFLAALTLCSVCGISSAQYELSGSVATPDMVIRARMLSMLLQIYRDCLQGVNEVLGRLTQNRNKQQV